MSSELTGARQTKRRAIVAVRPPTLIKTKTFSRPFWQLEKKLTQLKQNKTKEICWVTCFRVLKAGCYINTRSRHSLFKNQAEQGAGGSGVMSSLVESSFHAVHSFVRVCVCTRFLPCHFLGLNRAGNWVTAQRTTPPWWVFHARTREQDSHVCLCIHRIGRSTLCSALFGWLFSSCWVWDLELKHCPLLFIFWSCIISEYHRIPWFLFTLAEKTCIRRI